MTNEQSTICKLLAKALFGKDAGFAQDTAWMDVYNECIRQTVVSAVIPALPQEVPFDVRMKWINAAGIHAMSNHRVTVGHLDLHKLLTAEGIPYCILKGLSTIRYYPDPEMRSLGDVDFLVPEEYADKCDIILKKNGFEAEKNRLPYEWGYRKGGTEYELHLDINGVPEGKEGEVTKSYLAGLIGTGEVSESFGGPVVLPDDFHHGLVILLHTAKHMVGEGLGLRQISDWAVFADHCGEDFIEMFAGPLKKIGLWDFCLVLSAICVKYIGMLRYSWIPVYESSFLEEITDDMIQAGNLRRKNDTGARTILVEKTDAGGIAEGSVTGQLYKNLAQKVKYKWPVMNRAKALIPFGIAVMCAQYGAGTVTGKYRKIDPKELMREAKKKRELYGELRLFKGEDAD